MELSRTSTALEVEGVPMWNFLAREANWTEIVTNTLALGFSLMA